LTKEENTNVIGMIDGLTDAQADQLPALHQAAKNFSDNPTDQTKTQVLGAAANVVNAEN
jgi:hypothetical protein